MFGRFEASMILKAVSSVSGFLWCLIWAFRAGGKVVERMSWWFCCCDDMKREARAKRCRFWCTRMSQSTSSSRMNAVVRFCSTTLVEGVSSIQFSVNPVMVLLFAHEIGKDKRTFAEHSCVSSNFPECLAIA